MDVNLFASVRDVACLLPSWSRAGRLRFERDGFRLLSASQGDVFVPWGEVQSVEVVFIHRGLGFIPAVEVVGASSSEPLIMSFPVWVRRFPPHIAVDMAAALRARSVEPVNATR